MTGTPSTVTLYVKQGCPFCLKLRIFLLEAVLLDQMAVREFGEGTEAELAIRAEQAPHFEKVALPTIRLVSGAYTEAHPSNRK